MVNSRFVQEVAQSNMKQMTVLHRPNLTKLLVLLLCAQCSNRTCSICRSACRTHRHAQECLQNTQTCPGVCAKHAGKDKHGHHGLGCSHQPHIQHKEHTTCSVHRRRVECASPYPTHTTAKPCRKHIHKLSGTVQSSQKANGLHNLNHPRTASCRPGNSVAGSNKALSQSWVLPPSRKKRRFNTAAVRRIQGP
jgi:hypothetical protein